MDDPNEFDPLASFIVSAPLFTPRELSMKMAIRGSGSGSANVMAILVPTKVQRYCGHAKCSKVMTFERADRHLEFLSAEQLQTIFFRCRHCDEMFGVWMSWRYEGGKARAEKIGEIPRPEIGIPKTLEGALGKHALFWRRGMTLRHHGFGIGALAYFRRIVEASTGELLELVVKAMEASGDPEGDIARVRKLLTEQTTFDKKMEQASKVMPARFRPGEANPVKAIFEVVSDGLHGRTDEDCCALVDALAESMAFLFSKLNEEINSPKSLAEAVKAIERLRKKE